MTFGLRSGRRLDELVPALIVSATALFALPNEAGGFRLAKWGALGLTIALGAAWFLRLAPRRLPRTWPALWIFLASAIVLPALDGSFAPTHWGTALGTITGLALYFLTVIAINDTIVGRRRNLVVLTVAGSLCSLVVLSQAMGLRWLTSDIYTGLEFRSPGTFGNPNWAAAFLAPLVPLALGLAAEAKRPWSYYAAAGLMTAATLATVSKGGLLTLASGVFAFVLLNAVSRARRVQLLLAAGACTFVALTCFWHYDIAQASWLRGRLFLWQGAFWLVRENPLTGVGLGGYPAAYGNAAAAVIAGRPSAFYPLGAVDFAHNDVLQFAAEGGLFTAGAFVALVVVALVSAHRRGTALSYGVGAAVGALFVSGLVDSTLRVPSTFVLFFFLLGWLSSTAPSPKTPRASGAYRLLLVAVVVVGVVQGVRFTVGNSYWTLGQDALRAGRPALSNLERVRLWLPEHGRSASQYARALAREGRIDDAIAASAHAASLRFDFDDEIFRRDLQTRSLNRAAAIEQWREFGARFPGLVTPNLRLGALYLQANERAAAITAYEALLANSQPTSRAEAARVQARSILRKLLAAPAKTL